MHVHIISPKVQQLTRKSASKLKTMTVVQFKLQYLRLSLVLAFKQFVFNNFPKSTN
jgi:hypothetical protein